MFIFLQNQYEHSLQAPLRRRLQQIKTLEALSIVEISFYPRPLTIEYMEIYMDGTVVKVLVYWSWNEDRDWSMFRPLNLR